MYFSVIDLKGAYQQVACQNSFQTVTALCVSGISRWLLPYFSRSSVGTELEMNAINFFLFFPHCVCHFLHFLPAKMAYLASLSSSSQIFTNNFSNCHIRLYERFLNELVHLNFFLMTSTTTYCNSDIGFDIDNELALDLDQTFVVYLGQNFRLTLELGP